MYVNNDPTLFPIFISRLAEAEAVLVGDDDSPLGGSQGITIEKVTSEFGDTSAFALQVIIWALVQYYPLYSQNMIVKKFHEILISGLGSYLCIY